MHVTRVGEICSPAVLPVSVRGAGAAPADVVPGAYRPGDRRRQLGLVSSSGPVSGCWLFQLLQPGQCQYSVRPVKPHWRQR